MKVGMIIYNDFAHFEVMIASYILGTKSEIITIGMDMSGIRSGEQFIIQPQSVFEEHTADSLDAIIIPGGDEEQIIKNEYLLELLKEMHMKKKVIGAICSGVKVLAEAGVLKDQLYTSSLPPEEFEPYLISNPSEEAVVISENIVTAQAQGYADFGLALGKMMNIYEDEADYQETISFFNGSMMKK